MYFILKYRSIRLIVEGLFGILCFWGISNLGFTQHNSSLLSAQEAPTLKVSSTETSTSSWANAYFPVENFQSYTSAFGHRHHPITGKFHFHNGLDLAAPLGSYVRNWWAGKVVTVGQDNACGTYVKVKSGAWQHIYCHLIGGVESIDGIPTIVDRQGEIQIAQGQSVPTGAKIGRVGMTGRTTGPHLHWVLKHNGSYVDPALIIGEMLKRRG